MAAASPLAQQSPSSPQESLPRASTPPQPGCSPIGSMPDWQHRWEPIFSKNMSVVTLGNREYVVGVQVATLLRRETFNLYRSLKIKGVELIRAEPSHVDYLVSCNSIRRGTHSVTLIPLSDAVQFVQDERSRQDCGRTKRKAGLGRSSAGKKRDRSSSEASDSSADEAEPAPRRTRNSSSLTSSSLFSSLTSSYDGLKTTSLSSASASAESSAWVWLINVATEEIMLCRESLD